MHTKQRLFILLCFKFVNRNSSYEYTRVSHLNFTSQFLFLYTSELVGFTY